MVLGYCVLNPFHLSHFRSWLCNKQYLVKVKNVSSFQYDNWGMGAFDYT